VYLLPASITRANLLATTIDQFALGSNGGWIVNLLRGQQVAAPRLGAANSLGDVVRFQLAALDDSVPAGKCLMGLSVTWMDALVIVGRLFPGDVGEGKRIAVGGSVGRVEMILDALKTEEAFGMKFEGFEEQVRTVTEYYLSLKA